MIKWALMLGILVFLIGCEVAGEHGDVFPVIKEDEKIIDVYFCPRDDCESELAEFILSANEKVYCAFFDLDLEKVKDALVEQYGDGVDVKLIVDTDNYELVEDLDIPIKQDNRSAFMHNKFCIVDGEWISSGSLNPTINGAKKNNNNLIILKSEGISANYENEFNELWNGVFGKGDKTGINIFYLNESKVENYFCPEDECSEKVKDIIDKAEKSVYFMTFSFTHDGIANSLLLRMKEDIDVKGVFEKRGAGSEYSKYNVLKYQGVNVRKDNNSAVMHHKVFIIDNNTVITGSFNPSKSADEYNDENILIIHDKEIASRYLEEFDHIFENYTENEQEV